MYFNYINAFQSGGATTKVPQIKAADGTMPEAFAVGFKEFLQMCTGFFITAQENADRRARTAVAQVFRQGLLRWTYYNFIYSHGLSNGNINGLYIAIIDTIQKQIEEKCQNQPNREDQDRYRQTMNNTLNLNLRRYPLIGIIAILNDLCTSGIYISTDTPLNWKPEFRPIPDSELMTHLNKIQIAAHTIDTTEIDRARTSFRTIHSKKEITFKHLLKLYEQIFDHLFSNGEDIGYLNITPSELSKSRMIKSKLFVDLFEFRFDHEFSSFVGKKNRKYLLVKLVIDN